MSSRPAQAKQSRPAEARDAWLSPIELADAKAAKPSTPPRRRASNLGFLPLSLTEYLRLLDWTGRQIRRDKQGAIPIPADLAPILDRLHLAGDMWVEQVKHFGRWFRRAVGRASTLPKPRRSEAVAGCTASPTAAKRLPNLTTPAGIDHFFLLDRPTAPILRTPLP